MCVHHHVPSPDMSFVGNLTWLTCKYWVSSTVNRWSENDSGTCCDLARWALLTLISWELKFLFLYISLCYGICICKCLFISVVVSVQIATVLACMGSVESCCAALCAEPRVPELLVQFIHEKSRVGASTVELSACERLQQKSAIAINRLCHSEDIALIFVELHCK